MTAIFAYFDKKLYLCSQIAALMKKVLNIREPNVYARHLEAEVLHPLISVVHFDELEKGVRTSMNSYGVYGLFIQREFPQNLSYGVRPVQVSEWSVIAVAPGQIGGREDDGNPLFLNGWAVLWSPELMSKTDLEAHIAEYNFFSYFFTDSLPLDPKEWDAIEMLISALREELKAHKDSSALRNIVVGYLRLILDYCQRAYWRQNARITAAASRKRLADGSVLRLGDGVFSRVFRGFSQTSDRCFRQGIYPIVYHPGCEKHPHERPKYQRNGIYARFRLPASFHAYVQEQNRHHSGRVHARE